ncbi:hypothetical protein [Proteus mirabilis]|uniref:hypothetical protein n=1 Tax=Proteus mirabilis TaxID=584 RepID=UPI0013EEA448|nr:hypothetical protein [Proteus mirabilis]MBG2946617.1 hypothetical protein [Proteus mirabilis]MDF7255732.1 hypothetical protein [Proteus mirabilis]MDF7349914.1 hypothetical protein [Proteus mirabilis]NGX90797.1 hypothetical protein [Proteus mirabilis]
MIGLILYGVVLSLVIIVYYFKDWFKLTHNSLSSQKLFWGAILIPFISFLYFGFFSWVGHSVDLSSEGLNRFIMISKLPLGLLSLSIPFVAIITSLHRSIQTAAQISSANTQIDLAKKKNTLDELFSREKNFVEKCTYIEKQVGSISIKLKDSITTFQFNISAPHILFHKIYDTTLNNGNITYDLTGFINICFMQHFSTIEENLKLRYECIDNKNGVGIDGELPQLFVIVRAICRSFDILSVPTCTVPYFYIAGKNGNFQLCISSEAELKMLLRKYITLAESLFSITNLSGKYSFHYMKKYTFEGFSLFPSFDDGVIVSDYIEINWDSTVNAFKGYS